MRSELPRCARFVTLPSASCHSLSTQCIPSCRRWQRSANSSRPMVMHILLSTSMHLNVNLPPTPLGYEPLQVVCDLTKSDDIRRLVQSTIDRFEKIDVVVANAGVFSSALIGKLPLINHSTNHFSVTTLLFAFNHRQSQTGGGVW